MDRCVDEMTDAVHDEAGAEVVKNARSAAESGREAHYKAVDALLSAVDDPAVIADEADRDALVDQIFTYLAAAERPGKQGEAEATRYVNEAAAVDTAKKNAKLPELTLTPFEGKVTDWPRFRASFQSLVGRRRHLESSDKLEYLVASCRGEALRLVKQYQATNTPFDRVLAALEGRFGRPDLLLKQAFDAIGQIEPGQFSPSDSRKVLDELKPLLVTISANGVDPNEQAISAMLLAQIGPKIRGEIMTAWHRHCVTQGWVGVNLPRLNDFLLFADREVEALLSGMSASRGMRRREGRNQGQKPPTQRPPGTALPAVEGTAAPSAGEGAGRGKRGGGRGKATQQGGTGGGAPAQPKAPEEGAKDAEAAKPPPACAFCRTNNHKPENCPDGKKLTPRERRRYLRTGCWRCLALGHMSRACPKPRKPCGVPGCDQDHHRILHGDFEPQK
jgi:hypothetical protein